MQMLTTEAAQAEIINEDFTSSETVLPLPSFDQSLQRLPQQAFWRWTIQNLPCPPRRQTDGHTRSLTILKRQRVTPSIFSL